MVYGRFCAASRAALAVVTLGILVSVAPLFGQSASPMIACLGRVGRLPCRFLPRAFPRYEK